MIGQLCRGDAAYWQALVATEGLTGRLCRLLVVLVVCGGVYGLTIGWWRSPLQGLYAGVKFPLLLLLTAIGNAGVNGMLGQLQGGGLGFRQSLAAILSSFTILAVAVGALAPITMFFLLSMPSSPSEAAVQSHCGLILLHVLVIAGAGTASTIRLLGFLTETAGRERGRVILLSWLAANLFLGAQLSWNLRPYVGTPDLPVRFLRDNPFDGTFYEAVYNAAEGLLRDQ